jgi:hypothetical protein
MARRQTELVDVRATDRRLLARIVWAMVDPVLDTRGSRMSGINRSPVDKLGSQSHGWSTSLDRNRMAGRQAWIDATVEATVVRQWTGGCPASVNAYLCD